MILPNEDKVVLFRAADVTAENLGWMQQVAQSALLQPTQVTTALVVPTSLGSETLSVATLRTSASTVTSYSLKSQEEMLRTLKWIAKHSEQLPKVLFRALGNTVNPLLDADRVAAQRAMGSSSGLAQITPPSAQCLVTSAVKDL